MSMADIIMQGTARGLESRSRGMAQLGAGISRGMGEYTRQKERDEDQAIKSKEWEVKKRFMNAQADAQETSAKVARSNLTEQTTYKANLQYAADKGLTDAQTVDYMNKHGSANLSNQWLKGKEENDSTLLAQETTRLDAIDRRRKTIQQNFASVKSEDEFNQALAYTTKQLGKNPLEGQEGSWQEQHKMLMGNMGTMEQLTKTKNEALRVKNRTDIEKKVDAVKNAHKSKDAQMIEATERDLENSYKRKAALTHQEEMKLRDKRAEANEAYSNNADTILDAYLGQESFGGIDAMSEGYDIVAQHLIKQQEAGWEPARTKKWLEGFVTMEVDKDPTWGTLFNGPPKIVISEFAPDPVSMTSGDVHSMAKQAQEASEVKGADEYEYKMVDGKRMRRKVK